MNIGLCLCGGGAKGAYQSGVIKALYDRGINKFNAISGTSIGAVNGYFIFTNNVEKLEEMWTDIDAHIEHSIKIVDNTVDNSSVIEVLSNIDYKSTANPDFYVNYINIENKLPKEKIVNISELNKEEKQKIAKLSEGLYNGYNLDGGLVNNTLLNPLLNKNLDKIIVISMKHDYTLPDEIKNICNEDNIIIVRPKTVFDKNDTLRFEKEFCKQIYYEGYEIGKNLNISM